MTRITIGIPTQLDRALSPNGRPHWAVKADHVAALRRATAFALRDALNRNDPGACFQNARWPLVLDWRIEHGRGRRRWDDDNLIAALKPARDEIAACLGIDDRFMVTGSVTQGRDPEGLGMIYVTIREATDDERRRIA